MSFESQISQQVANLTNRLNTITQQARKIWELPWQAILNPASKIHVSNSSNESEFITIQQILDAAISFRQNQLLEANVSVDENDVTVDASAKWIINNINYELAADFTENIPYAEEGYTRNDILYADQFNQIHRQAGPETEGVSPTPNTPLNTVLVTEISVTDSTIGYTPPVIGIYPSLQEVLGIGNVSENFPIFFFTTLSDAETVVAAEEIRTQNGDSLVTMKASSLIIENANERMDHLSNSITWTDKATNYISKLWFNRIAPGFAEFNLNPYKAAGSYILATKDEVDLKLNISDYNDRFKGVYVTEAALIAAHPTGTAGDYAQVNETGTTKVVNYNWDAESNVWVIGGSGGSSATNTDMLPEGSSNFYFTTARVLATILSGISFATGTAITAADTVLSAFGKIQKQINDVIDRFSKRKVLTNPATGYTLTLTDADNEIIVHTSNTDFNETIPNNSAVAFPIGTVIESVSTGTGLRTTIPDTGVTLLTSISATSAQYEMRRFIKVDTNTWIIEGNNEQMTKYIPKSLASYTFVLSDAYSNIYDTYASGNNTFTIPLNSTVPFKIGTVINIFVSSRSGTTTINSIAGVTLLDQNGLILRRGGKFALRKVLTDTWIVELGLYGTTFSGTTMTIQNSLMVGAATTTSLTVTNIIPPGGGIFFTGSGTAGLSTNHLNGHRSSSATVYTDKLLFDPTAPGLTYTNTEISNEINATGAANAPGTISRGIYMNPILTSAPDHRALDIKNGSIWLPIISAVTSTYAVKNNDYTVNFTSGTFTATLPTAVGFSGKIYVLKNSGTGLVTIASTAGTIDGATTYILNSKQSITVVSDGANWVILSVVENGAITATLDFPATATGTNSDLTISYPGAVVGDIVVLGIPVASVSASSSFTAFVSATDVVTVRFNNYSVASINPASGTFKVKILK